jgi:hypothetical protein
VADSLDFFFQTAGKDDGNVARPFAVAQRDRYFAAMGRQAVKIN